VFVIDLSFILRPFFIEGSLLEYQFQCIMPPSLFKHFTVCLMHLAKCLFMFWVQVLVNISHLFFDCPWHFTLASLVWVRVLQSL